MQIACFESQANVWPFVKARVLVERFKKLHKAWHPQFLFGRHPGILSTGSMLEQGITDCVPPL